MPGCLMEKRSLAYQVSLRDINYVTEGQMHSDLMFFFVFQFDQNLRKAKPRTYQLEKS